jgi:hypothetical protein
MRILSAAAGLLLACGSASASGGLDCGADDAKASISLHGGVTRGMGGPLFQFEGRLEIKDMSIAEDLRLTTFAKAHVAQYWLDADELRIRLYREREGEAAHGSVELVIKTRSAGDEIGFDGGYELIVYDMQGAPEGKETRFKGDIGCSVE